MRLYSYVVARDYGFAPNPFHGTCTLATCKPEIRKTAQVGDLIIGTGSKTLERRGYLVFAMKVSEHMTFDKYWTDRRFRQKRPNLRGSWKQAYGDNIYNWDKDRDCWRQEDSHHSKSDGTPNLKNIRNDTRVDRVLVGRHFAYWGGEGPKIPLKIRKLGDLDICHSGRGHRCNFSEEQVQHFCGWLLSLRQTGYRGKPLEWST